MPALLCFFVDAIAKLIASQLGYQAEFRLLKGFWVITYSFEDLECQLSHVKICFLFAVGSFYSEFEFY